MPYSIEEHKHRFAAWAAGSAASVNGCRFKVWQGQKILEDAGLKSVAQSIKNLPNPENFDDTHKKWRECIIKKAKNYQDKNGKNLNFTHGVAAKLINIHLKLIYVCSGEYNELKVKAIHPPIDSVLLDALYDKNIGGKQDVWQSARKSRWSKFNSNQYQNVISVIKEILPEGAGLWEIEEYWQGHQ